MKQIVNKVYAPLFTDQSWRYAILMGGRAAGRSTVASQYALARLAAPEYFRCAIMRFVLGDVRNSIFQEIVDRTEEQGIKDQITIREQLLQFSYGNNRINGVGFRKSSGDQKSKLKSLASYNCVIIEEADEVAEEDVLQLDDSLRTKKGDIRVIFLLNPPDKNHWIINRFFNLVPSGTPGFYVPQLKSMWQDNTLFIHSNYRDNIQNIDQTTRNNYERYKTTNPEHYYNMIQGLVSEGRRGLIYTNWKPCTVAAFEELPYPSYYGLDFGYSNDPTALVEIKSHNDKIWLRELIYETGLTNTDLDKRFAQLGVSRSTPIYCDHEPDRIEELSRMNWYTLPAKKGSKSINPGIAYIQERQVFYTEDSVNIDRERQEYRWALDKNKEPTDTPIDDWNHGMDALRYGVHTHSSQDFIGFV